MEIQIDNWSECPFRKELDESREACYMSWRGGFTAVYFPIGKCWLLKRIKSKSLTTCPYSYVTNSRKYLRGLEPNYCPLKKEQVIVKGQWKIT